MERIDFSKNTMASSYSRGINSYPGSISVYPNCANLKELILPNAYISINCPASFFSGAPLEVLKLGTLNSGSSFYDYNRYRYNSTCSGKTTLREFSVKTMYFPHANANLSAFFKKCSNLEIFDMSTVDTSLNSTIAEMFSGCSKLTNIDLSWMKTNSVTSMANLFQNCSSMTSFNIDNFNYEQTTTIAYMFSGCQSLVSPKLKIGNAPVLTNATYLFNGCTSLKSVDLTEANLSLITSLAYWFNGCTGLETMNLSYLNAPNATNFTYMFNGCSNLKEVDLTFINSAANVNASYMFQNCINLTKIDIRNWQINKITSSSNYNGIFNNVPVGCQIIVKDENCRTWVKNKKSTFNNIVLASELEE